MDRDRYNLVVLCLYRNGFAMSVNRIAEWCCRYVAVDSNYHMTNCLRGAETPDLAARVLKRILEDNPNSFFFDGRRWSLFPHVLPAAETVQAVVPALFVTPTMRVQTVAMLPPVRLMPSEPHRRRAAPRVGTLVDPFEYIDEEEDQRVPRRRRRRNNDNHGAGGPVRDYNPDNRFDRFNELPELPFVPRRNIFPRPY